jgi:hypothetical protein
MNGKCLVLYLFLIVVHVLPASAVAASGAPSPANPKAKALLKQGNDLFREKRFAEALVTYTQAIDADPNYAAAWDSRGAAYAKTGSYDAARQDYDKAISLNPKNGHAYLNRAILNRKTGNGQSYLDDLKMSAQLGNETARRLLSKTTGEATPSSADPGSNTAGEEEQSSNAQGESPQPAAPQSGKVRNGNPVEPLSNGLLLTMERNEVRQKFGDAPRRGGFPSCDMAYDGFRVDTCYGAHISRAYISGRGVTLNSGIGVGSSKADVARTFGNPYGLTVGQYKLDFSYQGERVSSIKIEPADGDFKPYAASSGSASPRKGGNASAGGGKSDVVGTWYGTATTVGTIVIRADGTYDYNGSAGGRWKTSGNTIVFDGSLAAWGGGRATLKGGNLEFSWKSPEGWNQWFSFAR